MLTRRDPISRNYHNFIAYSLYYFIMSFITYTSVNKALNLQSFRINILKTGLFAETYIYYISIAVIVLEIGVVLILFLNKKLGLSLFLLMMLVFTGYITYLRFNGLYEVCGCGGILNGLSYSYHLLINLCLISAGLYCFNIVSRSKDEI
jgi:hypothetical protein